MAMKKRGRPKLEEQDALSEKVMVRLTTEERESAGQEARLMGVRTATWIRVIVKEKLRS